MPVTDAELSSLAQTHDIISIGVLADELRRRLHGTKTTFVRVATVASEVGAPISRAAAAGGAAVTAFSLADLEPLSAREGVTLRALLEELRAAGLELVAEAPLDRLQRSEEHTSELQS